MVNLPSIDLVSISVKSGLISIFTNSHIGYFSKFSNELSTRSTPIDRKFYITHESGYSA